VVYEDGLQSRDFVSVHDVVQALGLALTRKIGERRIFNVGTGIPTSILAVAQRLADVCGTEVRPRVVRKFRKGDIRHCYADIAAIRESLGYKPQVDFTDGLRELVDWAESTEAKDTFEQANRELVKRGLV
jgi:dTDP-L-rhamnose 4-epimerase